MHGRCEERTGLPAVPAGTARMFVQVELRGLEPLTLCLQSTFTLSVTVVGLGLNLFPDCPSRALSGFVVVRCSGQAPLDLLLTRSFYGWWPTAVFLVSAGFLVLWLLPSVSGFRPVLARGWHRETRIRLGMVAPSSPHPSSGGDQAKGKQEQLYSEYHIVLHARMIAFGHDAQPKRGSERADCACAPPLSFTCADREYRADSYAQKPRDRSPAVHECLLADRAVGTIMRPNTSGRVPLSAGTSDGFCQVAA
jgi:hypothetical protein